MKTYFYNDLSKEQINSLCCRNSFDNKHVFDTVLDIINNIKTHGDKALIEYSKKFDNVDLSNFNVPKKDYEEVDGLVQESFKVAIEKAHNNIHLFHKSQLEDINNKKIETSSGVYCWREFRAVENVGLYIPGGSAPLISTALMLVIPALIAKCKKIVVLTPPSKTGSINNELLWTLKFLGVPQSNIFMVGGAHGIAALAYGTEQIPKVDKIFGPGNIYVTFAKTAVSYITPIDMPAGPSEALVIADETSNVRFVASDLLSQAEHSPTSQVVLVATSQDIVNKIMSEMDIQMQELTRKDIILKALKNSFAIVTENIQDAIKFSNQYAPEHLLLSYSSFNEHTDLIVNAGSVFCGKYSSESFGDYASGTNHTIPTSGFAKTYSALSVLSFGKIITFQEVTKNGLKQLGSVVECLAEKESLDAHKNSVSIRLKEKKS